MNDLLKKLEGGEGIPIAIEIDPKSAAYLAGGIFAAIFLACLVGVLLLKR